MPRPRKDHPSVRLPTPPTCGNRDRRQHAEDYLRGLLLDGPLRPGDAVPIELIARRLGVSRQPVRDAVRRIAADGLVEILPQIGSRVRRPDPHAVADFFRVFAAAEGVVVGLAARRRTKAEALDFQVETRKLLACAHAAGSAESRDPGHRAINRSFYASIHAMARSPFTVTLAEGLWDLSDFYIRAAFGSLYFSKRVQAAHRQMAAAIVAGETSRAEAATRQHLESVGDRAIDALYGHQYRPSPSVRAL
ncbi:MAG: GntR family transcriptional regulator [Reyranella sp.]|uniref:GntR family transcriptional regulator n=1 Tax=Reyranella sp. TaxID=1929291 RepID=UPI002730C1C0|nr:GntR family transcriptional regulator [Reyranella sp.]MDP1962654.1 GntR family transcriptional regulator [Reyranella sp.]MDP2372534.1 GntR family transcriptional regulator [Reyranella sp.]